LLHRNSDGSIVGQLATSWEATDDTTWVFTIREGVTFSNGESLDAESVKVSLDLYRAPESVVASRYRSIEDVVVVDSHTVEVHTEYPDPFLPNSMSDNAFIMPAGYLDEVGIDGFATAPVGSGPYVLDNWVRGDRIEFTSN